MSDITIRPIQISYGNQYKQQLNQTLIQQGKKPTQLTAPFNPAYIRNNAIEIAEEAGDVVGLNIKALHEKQGIVKESLTQQVQEAAEQAAQEVKSGRLSGLWGAIKSHKLISAIIATIATISGVFAAMEVQKNNNSKESYGRMYAHQG